MKTELNTQTKNREEARAEFRDAFSRNKVQVSIGIVFIVIWLVYILGNPAVFTKFSIYRSFLSTIPFVGILALAYTFIVTVGEMDLSFPSVMAITAWVFCTLIALGVNVWLCAIVCIAAGCAAGLFNSFLVVKIGMPSLVATISTQFFWRGVVNVCASGSGIALTNAKDTLFANLAVTKIGDMVPMQAVWFIVLAIACWFLMNRHRFGSHVSFVGDNRPSAKMMGINVNRVRVLTLMMMGAFAAFSGILSNLEVQYFWPNQGEGNLMPTMAAVFVGGTSVVGGRGSILGTVLGAFIIGSLEAGIIALGISGFWVQLIYGAVVMISVSVYTLLSGKRDED